VPTLLPDEPPADAPPALAAIWPLVRRWAEGDDAVRFALVEAAGVAELQSLVDVGRPLLPAINEYLDATGDAEHAVPYGDLAQAILEAETELRRRS